MAALTSIDVVVAKIALTGHEAGIYGSASLVGRVILYLPAAIITVLLPRVAARAAERDQDHGHPAPERRRHLAFCTVSTVVYAAAGSLIVRIAFGPDYADAAGLLWLFGVAMTGYALLNVLLIYHLGHDRTAFAWLLVSGAVAQIGLFFALHASAQQLVVVDIVVAAGLLVSHELLTRGLLVRTLRSG